MVFEQLLGNALAQLAHTADLFSLDPEVSRTYFVKTFDESAISGFGVIASAGMTKAPSTATGGNASRILRAAQSVSRSSAGPLWRRLQ